jgi:hypothetical protein
VRQTRFIGWEHPEKVSNRDACFHAANLHESDTVCQWDNSERLGNYRYIVTPLW